MKVIIAGGRNFSSFKLLRISCNRIIAGRATEIVSGTARGADKLGEMYAHIKGIPVKKFTPNWDKYGKSAGYKRNEEMAEYADMLIAFWDYESKGTKHMIELAESKGLNVYVVGY